MAIYKMAANQQNTPCRVLFKNYAKITTIFIRTHCTSVGIDTSCGWLQTSAQSM